MADLFRKSALEKLSSPEQLDRAVVITPPSFWIALAGGGVIIIVALIWGIFGRLPANVESNGIYVSGNGVGSIYSEVPGVVTSVEVQAADYVSQGQVIAYVGGGELSEEVQNLSRRITAVQQVTLESTDDQITADNKQLIDVKSELITLRMAYKQSRDHLKEKEKLLLQQKEKSNTLNGQVQSLKKQYYGTMAGNDSAQAQLDYAEAQAEEASAKQYYESAYAQLQQAGVDKTSAEGTFKETETALNQARIELNQAEAQMNQYLAAYQAKEQEIAGLKESGVSPAQLQAAEAELATIKIALTQAQTDYKSSQTNFAQYGEMYNQASAAREQAATGLVMIQESFDRYQAQLEAASGRFEAAKNRYHTALNSQQTKTKEQSIASNEYSQKLSEHTAAKSLYESLQQEVENLKLQTKQAKEEMNLKKESLDVSFTAAKEAVLSSLMAEQQKHTESLKRYEITAVKSGEVQEVLVDQGTVVNAGTEILRINQSGADQNIAVCYIPVAQGKKIMPGMKVMIYPSTVNTQEYGHMTGTVETVAEYVTSSAEIQKQLGDETLVQAFLNEGPVVEVTCAITLDSSTVSGYYWSSRKGVDVVLTEGTMLSANIVTEEKAPITMLLPYLKEKLTVKTDKE